MNQRNNGGTAFILPAILWVGVIIIIPVIYLIYLSFTNSNALKPPQFIWGNNYARVISDVVTVQTIGRTLLFAVASTIVTLVIGILTAWVFSFDVAGIRFLRALFAAPLFIAPVAIGTLASLFFSPYISPFFDTPLLSQIGGAQIALIAADAWQWTPLVFMVVLTAIRTVPSSVYDAARLETNSHAAIFSFITLPRVRSALILITLLRLIDSFRMFDLPFTMTNGGPANATQTLSLTIYKTGFQFFELGTAAALAVIMLIPVLVLGWIILAGFGRRFAPAKPTTLMAYLEGLRAK